MKRSTIAYMITYIEMNDKVIAEEMVVLCDANSRTQDRRPELLFTRA